MQKQTRLAFDLGGVIINRGAFENSLVDDSIVSVRLAVQKFGSHNVFIISKAKEKYIQRNIDLLRNSGFFDQTQIQPENVYFVDQYEDKGVLGNKLGITHILDDSIKVARIALKSGFTPILFGDNQQFLKQNPGALKAGSWKGFRKLLQKIPK